MEQMTFDFLAPEETEETIPSPDEKEYKEWKQKKKEAYPAIQMSIEDFLEVKL